VLPAATRIPRASRSSRWLPREDGARADRGRRPGALNSKEAAGICAAGSTSTPCPARFAAPAGRTASPRFAAPPGAPLRREFVEVGARELREDGVPLDVELAGAREGEVGRRGRGRRRRNRGPAPPQLRIRQGRRRSPACSTSAPLSPRPAPPHRADLRRRRHRKGPRPTQGLKVVVVARRRDLPPPQGLAAAIGTHRRGPPRQARGREGGR
jgi:hypothetical protein